MSARSEQLGYPRAATAVVVALALIPLAYAGYAIGDLGGLAFPAGSLVGLTLSLVALWFAGWRLGGKRVPTLLRTVACGALTFALVVGWAAGVWVAYQFTDPAWAF